MRPSFRAAVLVVHSPRAGGMLQAFAEPPRYRRDSDATSRFSRSASRRPYRGQAKVRFPDERSDVDLLVVAEPGWLEELWAERPSIAEALAGFQ